jgi:hypothetical protein
MVTAGHDDAKKIKKCPILSALATYKTFSSHLVFSQPGTIHQLGD